MQNKKLLISILIILFAIILIVLLIFVNPKEVAKIKPALAEKLSVATDKIEYNQGETVKIIITSGSEYTLVQKTSALSEIKYVKYLGDNYGVGFIEKNINACPPNGRGEWAVIEPVWRCGDSCFTECLYDHSIKPGGKKIFEWKQTVLNCDQLNRTEKFEPAGPGRYRISSGFWNEEKQENNVIYSNEFVIK